MKNFIAPVVIGLLSMVMSRPALAQTSPWTLPLSPLVTRWAKDVHPDRVLPAYPRPQMVRRSWINLNGLWEYTITSKDAGMPLQYSGKILVPFPIESALSGIRKVLLPTQNLWYHRILQRPAAAPGDRVLVHFGAVDWRATTYINGVKVGVHSGGYTSFTYDITDRLHAGGNDFVVQVFDPTDEGVGPHGKQTLHPQDIYYTASSGIWQTVWMEVVPAAHIREIRLTPDIDKELLMVSIDATAGHAVEVSAYDGGNEVAVVEGTTPLSLPLKSPHLWSPADPHLYQLTIRLKAGNQVIDEVSSYFGMRKISIAKDSQGIERIFLNNHPYYNLGVLDQGFWPDGGYTAPTDEALAFDIEAIKAMGFNTIRKHIKVEPERWYYYADSLGILVWQDMPNPSQRLPLGSKEAFEHESADILHQLYNHPAITTWVLFNEHWGQYDQARLTRWIKTTDPTRLVDGHTGELLYVNDRLRTPVDSPYVDADLTDVHSYPDPRMPIRQPGKAQVLGEFGGIGTFIPDHQWNGFSGWGYIEETPAGLAAKYTIMNEHLQLMKRRGLSGSIYTQPFDVEGEQNGLMTYDREVVKIPFGTLRAIHHRLNPDIGTIPAVAALDADTTDPGLAYARLLEQYIDGQRDSAFLLQLLMRAIRTGDQPGAREAGEDYIASLSRPLSDEHITLIAQFTTSIRDPGFRLMVDDSVDFRRVLGNRAYAVALMNMIYKDQIQPAVEGHPDPDWAAIGETIKPYGAPGEEILLRVETIYYLNNQDWQRFVPVARDYLTKYGDSITDSEKQVLEANIKRHVRV